MADKPIILITGAAGSLGQSLAAQFKDKYEIVGLDLKEAPGVIAFDLTDRGSVERALAQFKDLHGDKIAAVIHLAA